MRLRFRSRGVFFVACSYFLNTLAAHAQPLEAGDGSCEDVIANPYYSNAASACGTDPANSLEATELACTYLPTTTSPDRPGHDNTNGYLDSGSDHLLGLITRYEAIYCGITEACAGKLEILREFKAHADHYFSMRGELPSSYLPSSNPPYTPVKPVDKVWPYVSACIVDGNGSIVPDPDLAQQLTNNHPYPILLHTGRIVYPIAKFVQIVKKDPALASEFGAVADTYAGYILDALKSHDDEWDNAKGAYFWHSSADTIDMRNSLGLLTLAPTQPYNVQAVLGKTHVIMWDATGDGYYHNKATKIGRYIREALHAATDGSYVWKYQEYSQDTNPEDHSHGADVANFAKISFEHGIVFTRDDLARFAKTFTKRLVRNGELYITLYNPAIGYDVPGTVEGDELGEHIVAAAWLPLVPYDTALPNTADHMVTKFNEIAPLTFVIEGNTYSVDSVLELANGGLLTGYQYLFRNYAQIFAGEYSASTAPNDQYLDVFKATTYPNYADCDANLQCQSGVCYSGQKCTAYQGDTSYCYNNVECESGLCEPLNSDPANTIKSCRAAASLSQPGTDVNDADNDGDTTDIVSIFCNNDRACQKPASYSYYPLKCTASMQAANLCGICYASISCQDFIGVGSYCYKDNECADNLVCTPHPTFPGIKECTPD